MTLKDMVNVLRIPCTIKIRDLDNDPICTCGSDSKGVYPYLDLEVVQWFIYTLGDENNTICVFVNDAKVEEECDTPQGDSPNWDNIVMRTYKGEAREDE